MCQCLNAGFSSRIFNKLNSALRTNDQQNTRRHVGYIHCSHTLCYQKNQSHISELTDFTFRLNL